MAKYLVILITGFIASQYMHAASCDDHFIAIYNEFSSDEISRPLKRFARTLNYVFDIIFKYRNNHELLIKEIMSKDVRGQVFLTEGLLRIYSKVGGNDKVVNRVYDYIQQLEDTIGKYSLDRKMLKTAIELNIAPQVISYLKDLEINSYQSLLNILISKWDHPNNRLLVKDLIEIDQKHNISSKKVVKKFFVESIKKLEKTKFDLDELEDGIHVLRRKMRWLVIYIQSLQGRVQFHEGVGKSSISRFNQIMQDPDFKDDHYAKFYISPEEQSPLLISKPYFLALGKASREIGHTKDNGELFMHLTHAYVNSGLYTNYDEAFIHVENVLKEHGVLLLDWKSEAQKMIAFLKGITDKSKDNLYKLLAKEFKKI